MLLVRSGEAFSNKVDDEEGVLIGTVSVAAFVDSVNEVTDGVILSTSELVAGSDVEVEDVPEGTDWVGIAEAGVECSARVEAVDNSSAELGKCSGVEGEEPLDVLADDDSDITFVEGSADMLLVRSGEAFSDKVDDEEGLLIADDDSDITFVEGSADMLLVRSGEAFSDKVDDEEGLLIGTVSVAAFVDSVNEVTDGVILSTSELDAGSDVEVEDVPEGTDCVGIAEAVVDCSAKVEAVDNSSADLGKCSGVEGEEPLDVSDSVTDADDDSDITFVEGSADMLLVRSGEAFSDTVDDEEGVLKGTVSVAAFVDSVNEVTDGVILSTSELVAGSDVEVEDVPEGSDCVGIAEAVVDCSAKVEAVDNSSAELGKCSGVEGEEPLDVSDSVTDGIDTA
uniref:Uncharacterized protein n=1 Tax=Xenopus tropicalis TaxID=8364 RepID=A0A1B8XSC8_XENTR